MVNHLQVAAIGKSLNIYSFGGFSGWIYQRVHRRQLQGTTFMDFGLKLPSIGANTNLFRGGVRIRIGDPRSRLGCLGIGDFQLSIS